MHCVLAFSPMMHCIIGEKVNILYNSAQLLYTSFSKEKWPLIFSAKKATLNEVLFKKLD